VENFVSNLQLFKLAEVIMNENAELKLSGQRALWGAIPPGLRSVSAEICDGVIRWRCVFESENTKKEYWEELSAAAAEVIADFPNSQLLEEYIVLPPVERMDHLQCLLFLRHESERPTNWESQ
jgi:hypothetical protein